MPEERSDAEKEADAGECASARTDSAARDLDTVDSSSEREAWLFANDLAMRSILQGLREAAAGEVHDAGTFIDCVTDDDVNGV